MRILTISGSGRTGSTLVSTILSQAGTCFNLGQLRDFWASYQANLPCSCGRPLQSCDIWSDVVAQCSFGVEDFIRMNDMTHRFMREAKDVHDWNEESNRKKMSTRHRQFLDRLTEFLAIALQTTKVTTLIDASKSPEMALAFSLIESVDLKVLNLTRDPRGVASSWARKGGAQFALQMVGLWRERQERLANWSANLGSRFALLRYEDLTAQPREVVNGLASWAGINLPQDMVSEESAISIEWNRLHLYPPGNETYIKEKSNRIEIKESDAWRSDNAHTALHHKVEHRLGPLMSSMGYAVSADTLTNKAPRQASADLPNPVSSVAESSQRSLSNTQGKIKKWVFLICSERSGSNLISAMLNSHPDIAAPPPFHFFRDIGLNWHNLVLSGPDSKASTDWIMKVLSSRISSMHSETAAKTFREWLASRKSIAIPDLAEFILGELGCTDQQRIVFVKENNLHKMLFFILKYFPDSKFVFQVRDPRDYFLSAVKRRQGQFGNKFGSSLHALEVWREDQTGGLLSLAHLGPKRVFFQRYEDLLSNPEGVLTALCDFLGVEYLPQMLRFHESDFSKRLAVPGGPRENLSKPLISQNARKYRTGLKQEQIRMIEAFLGDLMQSFGYTLDVPESKHMSRQELFWPMFMEPLERLSNGETAPFYQDGRLDFNPKTILVRPQYGAGG